MHGAISYRFLTCMYVPITLFIYQLLIFKKVLKLSQTVVILMIRYTGSRYSNIMNMFFLPIFMSFNWYIKHVYTDHSCNQLWRNLTRQNKKKMQSCFWSEKQSDFFMNVPLFLSRRSTHTCTCISLKFSFD